MREQVQTASREAVLVEDAALHRMMGLPVLEAVPARGAPYQLTDPVILVHEARFRPAEMAGRDTRHPHRGFDNLWYVLEGSASTGHTTGPGGAIERARLREGSLLWLRTGRGAWHAERVGAEEVDAGQGDTEFRSVLFWVTWRARTSGPSRAPRCCTGSRSRGGRRATRPSGSWWARAHRCGSGRRP